ncbi:MAG: hypothetical protein QNJ64_07165 [Crocosphaera sp.]|nr:hypothetical protein [Crocosphaera sp.]
MTVARDYLPTPPPPRPNRRRKRQTTRDHNYQLRTVAQQNQQKKLTTVEPRKKAYSTKVTPLPTKPKQLPLALQFLLLVQKSSTTLTCGLVALTLGAYSWTVYSPTLWTREFSKLKTLQQNERQLASTNESLKHKMAEKAEQPGSGLTEPNPHQSIFLAPADVSQLKVSEAVQQTPKPPIISDNPIAY